MLLINLGQLNLENWEFANFPNFCGDSTTFVLYLKISISDSPSNENLLVKKYFQENMFLGVFVS